MSLETTKILRLAAQDDNSPDADETAALD